MAHNPICLKILSPSPSQARAALLQIYKIALKRYGIEPPSENLYIEVDHHPKGRCTVTYVPEHLPQKNELMLIFKSISDAAEFLSLLKHKKYGKLPVSLYESRKPFLVIGGYDGELIRMASEFSDVVTDRKCISRYISGGICCWKCIPLSDIVKCL